MKWFECTQIPQNNIITEHNDDYWRAATFGTARRPEWVDHTTHRLALDLWRQTALVTYRHTCIRQQTDDERSINRRAVLLTCCSDITSALMHYSKQTEKYHWPQQQWTRMCANAQRDGRPAEYRWRPLFNAAKFRWRPLPECRAVTLPRHETRWNL